MAETQEPTTAMEVLEGKVLVDTIKLGPIRFIYQDKESRMVFHGIKRWLKESEETAWFVTTSEEGNDFYVCRFELQEQGGVRYIDFNGKIRESMVPFISSSTKTYQELAETHRKLLTS